MNELDLTSIQPVTISNLNAPILNYVARNGKTPDSIVLTTEQMATLTGLYVDQTNVGWNTYRGIQVKLIQR